MVKNVQKQSKNVSKQSKIAQNNQKSALNQMLFWVIRPSIPTKNYENKTGCVFFHCASDGNAPGRRNTIQKLKNNEQLNFYET